VGGAAVGHDDGALQVARQVFLKAERGHAFGEDGAVAGVVGGARGDAAFVSKLGERFAEGEQGVGGVYRNWLSSSRPRHWEWRSMLRLRAQPPVDWKGRRRARTKAKPGTPWVRLLAGEKR
jgi:hypothetical protein